MKRTTLVVWFVWIAIAAATLWAITRAGTMQTCSTTNELVMLNPYTINTNTFVVSEGSVGDTTATVWTFVNGDATGPDATHLAPTLYPAAGRWVKNTGGSGGTNIFNTIIVTNLTVISNLTADTLWTNKAGVLQPTDLTLPVMITNQLSFSEGMSNLIFAEAESVTYSNKAVRTHIKVASTNGSVWYGMNGANAEVFGGNVLVLENKNGRGVYLYDTTITPTVDNTISLSGPTSSAWFKDSGIRGTNFIAGMNDGLGNYSMLAQYHTGTNGAIVFDSQSSGTAGDPREFNWKWNGTNIAGLGVNTTTAIPSFRLYYTNGISGRMYINSAGGVMLEAQDKQPASLWDATNGVTYYADNFLPRNDSSVSLGTDAGYRWKDLALSGKAYIFGYKDAVTNYSRLAVSQTDTNSPVVFDIQTWGSGTNGANQGFSFRTNGVEIFNATGSGGPSSGANWVAVGATDSRLAGMAAPAELYTGSFKLYRSALTPIDAGTSLDFGSTNRYWSCTLTGAVTFATANLAAGKHANVMITGVATNANITFPAGWIFIGYKPTYLSANKHADLYLKATSGADAGVWAYYGEEQ